MSKLRVNEIEPFSSTGIAIGGPPTLNPSAILDVQSTDQGMLAPRMTTSQRNAIASPVEGLLIYNLDDGRLEQYSSGQWTVVGNGQTPIKNVLRVIKNTVLNEGDFSSINAALASITDNSPTNQYSIQVGPGVFVENPIFMKPYVYIIGSDFDATVIQANDPTEHLIFAHDYSSISDCLLTGVTTSGKALIYYASTTGTVQTTFWVQNVRFGNADTLAIADGTIAHSNMFINSCRYGGVYQFNTGFIARTGSATFGRVVVRNSTSTKMTAPYPVDMFLCDGAGCEMNIKSSVARTGSIGGGGNGVRVRNGGTLRIASADLDGWTKGLWVENVGSAPFVIGGILTFINNTFDAQIDHPGVTGGMAIGADDDNKISINPAATSFGFVILGLEDGDLVVSGKVKQNQVDGTFTDITTLTNNASAMGLLSDGDINAPTLLFPFKVTVESGTGYLQKSDGSLRKITWPNTDFTVSANSVTWLYFDSSSVLNGSPTAPNPTENIVLGRIVSDSSGIIIVEESGFLAEHASNMLGQALRDGIGTIYANGSTVAEVSTRELAVSAGTYYLGEREFQAAGGSPITFSSFYQNGSGGFTKIASQTQVDNTKWDDGSGTLASIGAGNYVKHSLYALGDSTGDFDSEAYFLVYSQAQYTALTLAEQGSLPTPPSFLSNAVTLIASIIVQQGTTHIVEIRDERPLFLNKRVSSIAATTYHHNLLGLDDFDDHLRYLPVNGSRPMTGDLPMGTHNVTNAGTYNGVVVENHHARHQPGGADAIPTAAPSTTLSPATGNVEGVSTSLARADHTHAVVTALVADISTIQPDATASAGTANTFARGDHRHAIAADAPTTTLAPSTTNAEGVGTSFSRNDHTHAVSTALVGDITTVNAGDVASAGTTDNFARGNHEHAVATAAAVTQNANTTNTEGVSTSLARADHTHTLSTGTPSSQTPDQTNAPGTSANLTRADHTHNIPTSIAVDVGSSNAQGSAASFSRGDHVHKGLHSIKAGLAGTQRFGDVSIDPGNGTTVVDDGSGNLTVDTQFGANEFVITSTSGLTINYTGGRFVNGINGTITTVPAGSIAVAANTTLGYLYVAFNSLSTNGTVTASTTPPTLDSIPFAQFVSGPSTVTSTSDIRSFVDYVPLGNTLRMQYPGSGLTVNYNSGGVRINGTLTAVPAGTIVLAANIASGAIYVDPTTMLVTANTTGTFPSNCTPMATYTTNASAVTALTGARAFINNNVVFGSSGDIVTIVPDATAAAGATNRYADAGHTHAIATAVASTISTNANAQGSATSFARSNHTHQLTAGSALNDHVPQFDGSNWQAVFPESFSVARAFRLAEDWISNDPASIHNWTSTVTGGASAIAINTAGVDSSHPGVVVITAGNAAARFATLHLGTPMILGGGAVNIEILFNLQTLTNAAFRIGLGDTTAADFNNGVYLEYNSGVSANWLIKTASGGTRTSTTTTTPATANAWHKLQISINAGATSVSYTLDGVSLGTIATNIPTAQIGPNLQSDSLAGTNTTFWVDYFFMYQRFTTSR